jgi:predicted RNase H-like nuclease (RuvC/YqgF family)
MFDCPTRARAQAAMAERLRRKAELQQKAAAPKSLNESFQSERSKQKELSSQTKEQRRNAMCEELGRGC